MSQYSEWKSQQGEEIYYKSWRPHAPVILMMILDRVKEESMKQYLSEVLKLDDPEEVLSDCREWAQAPDPHVLDIQDQCVKDDAMDRLLEVWQTSFNLPHSEDMLSMWMPTKDAHYPYEQIEKEARAGRTEGDWGSGVPVKSGADLEDGSEGTETPHLEAALLKEVPKGTVFGKAQKLALKSLTMAYGVSLRAKNLKNVAVAPRTHCLLVAPSGSGKTFLSKALAAQLGLPFFSVNVSSWLLVGSKTESVNTTLVQLASFILSNKEGVIYLDELDKVDGNSDWTNHLRLEIHNLLDGQMGQEVRDGLQQLLQQPISDKDLNSLNQSLKSNFFIIAGGTWQDYWENQGGSALGFNAQVETKALNKAELIKSITPELLQRFQQDLVVLPPLSQEDFLDLANQLGEQILNSKDPNAERVREKFLHAVQAGAEQAVKHKIGMRFLEECMTSALKVEKVVVEEKVER